MALLQISEPGHSPNPHERRVAVGIDLGTTHSLVAVVRSGVAECLPDAQGRVILPSVVRYLAGGGREIGAGGDQHHRAVGAVLGLDQDPPPLDGVVAVDAAHDRLGHRLAPGGQHLHGLLPPLLGGYARVHERQLHVLQRA